MTDVSVAAMHVLVVDPDPGSVDFVRSALADACVRHAPDAYCALNDVESGPVDLIVLELRLPGASALEFLKRLRARGHRVPVVGFSHVRGPSAALRDLGVSSVLLKPVSAAALGAAVRKAGEESSAGSGPWPLVGATAQADDEEVSRGGSAGNDEGGPDAPVDVHAYAAGDLRVECNAGGGFANDGVR